MSSPELQELKALVQSSLPTKKSPQLFVSTVQAKPDGEDMNLAEEVPGFQVYQNSPVFCAETEASNQLNAQLALNFFLPYDTEMSALGVGLHWKQKDLDLISGLLTKMVSGCQFPVAQIQMIDDNNASINLLSIQDPLTGESLLVGFIWK